MGEDKLVDQGPTLTPEERAAAKRKRKCENRRLRKQQNIYKAPKPTSQTKEELAKEALTRVYEALNGDKDCHSKGYPFVLPDWVDKYKAALGPYKKFIASQPSLEIIQGDHPQKWIFKRTLDAKGIENSD